MFQRLRRTLMNNLGIKITSLVLALAVYAHVFSREERVAVFAAPLSLEGLPSGLSFAGELPSAVPVRVRARGTELLRLRAQPPRVVVHLGAARQGLLQRPVTIEDVVLPPGSDATVVALTEPTLLELELTPFARRHLPVKVVLAGSPALGWVEEGPVEVQPETLQVEGRTEVVLGMDSLRTKVLSLAGRTTSVDEKVEVEVPSGIRLSRQDVIVRLKIRAASPRS